MPSRRSNGASNRQSAWWGLCQERALTSRVQMHTFDLHVWWLSGAIPSRANVAVRSRNGGSKQDFGQIQQDDRCRVRYGVMVFCRHVRAFAKSRPRTSFLICSVNPTVEKKATDGFVTSLLVNAVDAYSRSTSWTPTSIPTLLGPQARPKIPY